MSQAEVEAESERAQLKLPLRKARKGTNHPGRQELPTHLPRVEKIIASPEQCVCARRGDNTELIGYETSEQLDVEPAKHFVLVTKRRKARLPPLRHPVTLTITATSGAIASRSVRAKE